MRTLMISLDRHIFDPSSRVAVRMLEYGKQTPLDIVIPTERAIEIELSSEVHVFGTGGAKWEQFFTLVKKISALQRTHDYELITAQDPFLLGLAALITKKNNVKFEVQLHGDFFSTSYYRTSGIKNWLYYWLARLVIRRADVIRVVGERIKKSIVDLGIPEQKIVVRPVSMEKVPESIQPDLELREKYSNKRIFLTLGRLHPVKNLGWLFKRLANLPLKDWHLLVVGDGEQKSDLELLVKKLDLKNEITFIPWTKEPFSLLKTADCLLFPSLSEGYGLAPVEAVSVGCPVIMNDVGVAGYELTDSLVSVISVANSKEWERALENQKKRKN